MAIVVGLDQHRAQITAGWIDTDSGELGRACVWPAHRDDVRKFFTRLTGGPVEVALEATTGWRFVVEELHAIGGDGPSRRARGDRGAGAGTSLTSFGARPALRHSHAPWPAAR